VRLKIIKNELEHAQALERLMELMDLDPAEGSSESDELEVLAMLIEQYEEEAFPMDLPSPLAAIEFRMEQQGLKRKDLEPYIGSAPKVSEVLNGKRPLSLNMIRRLSEGLGIPAEVLIQDPARQQHFDHGTDWQAFPLSEMRKRGYFPDFKGSLYELKEYAAETLSPFLAAVGLSNTEQPIMLRTAAHRLNNDKEADPYAVRAWQARALHLAKDQKVGPYLPGTVTKEWMQDLVRLSWSQRGPALAVEYLNRSGIRIVFEEHLPKTYLDGAVCLSEGKQPVIAMTLRHDRLDNFWFTLMHELAHIALHFDGNQTWFLDNLDVASADPREDEADALAQEVLIPRESVQQGLPTTVSGVEALAKQLSISPHIVAGRVRRERNDYMIFGRAFQSHKAVSKALKEAGIL